MNCWWNTTSFDGRTFNSSAWDSACGARSDANCNCTETNALLEVLLFKNVLHFLFAFTFSTICFKYVFVGECRRVDVPVLPHDRRPSPQPDCAMAADQSFLHNSRRSLVLNTRRGRVRTRRRSHRDGDVVAARAKEKSVLLERDSGDGA